ncbi:MAG TPA: IS630 family transposase [Allocoleopsis sp.]
MEKQDARYLKQEVQQYLRQQAVRLHQQGKAITEIATFLGVHRNTVTDWWWQYQQYGEEGLLQQQRGRKLGEGRTLNPEQEETIQQLMLEHLPDELEIDSALWTRRAVQELIERMFEVKMPIRTVGEYLKRWGFTPQKPIKRAYEQDPQAVKEWLDNEYPAIVERAKAEGAEIAWGDESGLRSDTQRGRGYAPVGETPEVRISPKRVRVNFIASVSNQGAVSFMLYTRRLTAEVFIEFLERLIKGAKRKLFWIVDNHPVHSAKAVQQWLEQHQDQIELFKLPKYSPELNPVEYLNCDVKQGVHSKPPTQDLETLKHRLLSHLRKLQKLPERVKRYFKHPSIAYAAQ